MRLIDVKHLLNEDVIDLKDKSVLEEESGIPDKPYAILSHTWGRQLEVNGEPDWGGEDDEIVFADVADRDTSTKKPDAWRKIKNACEAAQKHGCDYLWVDTCCFNKESSAELDESINAMFSWYQQSKVCLVYLADLEVDSVQVQEDEKDQCRWFKRGWTLQELIAPKKVEFYNKDWEKVGSRDGLVETLQEITQINREALSGKECLSFTVAERMQWAAHRKTKRPEDRAYSLLGLFGVQMSLIYGIGEKAAFRRLQMEIIQNTTDMTVFAWSPDINLIKERENMDEFAYIVDKSSNDSADKSPNDSADKSSLFCSMLADSPDQFKNSFMTSPAMTGIKSMELEGHFSVTNKGVSLDASTLRITPKEEQASKPALVLLIGYIDDLKDMPGYMLCYGIFLQKIGSAHYVRHGTFGLAEFKEDKAKHKLKTVPRHQCYISMSPKDVDSTRKKSHSRAVVVKSEYNPSKTDENAVPGWSMKVLDRVPERIWDFQEGLFFRVSTGHRDAVRAVSVELHLLSQKVKFAVMLHRYKGEDKVFILDEKNPKWPDVKRIFGPSQRFDSLKWDDLMIDLKVQSEYLDVVAQGRSYRVSATLGKNADGKMELTLDVASDAYQQIESLKRRLKVLEDLVTNHLTCDNHEREGGDASKKRPRNI